MMGNVEIMFASLYEILCLNFFFFTDQMPPKFFIKQNGNCRLIIKVYCYILLSILLFPDIVCVVSSDYIRVILN